MTPKRKHLLIISAIAAVVCLLLIFRAVPDKSENYYKQGLEKLQKGDYDAAIADFDKAIQLNPKDAKAFCKRGLAKARMPDNFDSSTYDFNEMSNLKQGYVLFRSKANTDRDDYDGALTDFNKAIQLNPNYPEAFKNRAYMKMVKLDFDSALTDFNKAIELHPAYAEAFYGRGHANLAKGDSERAIADYTKAIEIKPDYADAFTFRGFAKSSKGDYDGAIADLTEAIRIKQSLGESGYIELCYRALVKTGVNPEGAIADCNEAIRIKENLGEKADMAYGTRALAKAFGKWDFEGAIADLSKTIQIRPDAPEYYCARGVFTMGTDPDSSLADFNKAIRLNPDFAEAYYMRGWSKDIKGDYDGAIADFRKALAIAPEMLGGEAWFLLAETCSKKKDKKECFEALSNAIKLNPEYKERASEEKAFDWLRDDPDFKRLIGK